MKSAHKGERSLVFTESHPEDSDGNELIEFCMTRKLIVLLAAAIAIVGFAPPATATSQSELSHEDVTQLREFFSENHVAQESQTKLLDKLDKGEMWDSLKPDSVPVSSATEEVNGQNVTVDRYQDGSIAVSSASVPVDVETGAITT